MIRRPSAADLQMFFSSPLLQALSQSSNLWIVRNRRATTSPLSLRIMGYPAFHHSGAVYPGDWCEWWSTMVWRSEFEAQIRENQPAGTSILRVSASDRDHGEEKLINSSNNPCVKYAFTSEKNHPHFGVFQPFRCSWWPVSKNLSPSG